MKKIGSWAALFLGGIVGVGAMMAATRIFNPADDKKDNKEEQKQEEQLPEGTPYTLATFQDSTLYTMRPATTETKVAGKWFRIFFEYHNPIKIWFTGQTLPINTERTHALFTGTSLVEAEALDKSHSWGQILLEGNEEYVDVGYDFEYAQCLGAGPDVLGTLDGREDKDALSNYLDIYIPTKNVGVYEISSGEKVGELVFNATTRFEEVDSEYNYVIYELIPN